MAILLIDKIKQKNNGTFKLVDAEDVEYKGRSVADALDDLDPVQEYETFEEFPVTGKEGVIYIAKSDNTMYRWDDTAIKYYEVGNPLNNIKFIDGDF